MAIPNFNFTTGQTQLPDVGTLMYNGCVFGPLFETKVSGNCVQDAAKRTVKLMEYTISVEGYVTLPAGANDISGTMATLYSLLTAQGGKLVYMGKAFDIITTPTTGNTKAWSNYDVEWGPAPQLLEFQPLGAGRSAKISWKVVVRMVPPAVANKPGSLLLLQLNYETSVSYDEQGFSTIGIKGTMEVPITRAIQQDARVVQRTVDDQRSVLDQRILRGIDLGRFHMVKRDIHVSRDKRTMEFDFEAQEKPYMDIPEFCTVAHGSYSVRPVQVGVGLQKWLCTLKATYTVAGGLARYNAWNAFLALYELRMQRTVVRADDLPTTSPTGLVAVVLSDRPLVIDFTCDEGMYLDSRTISFGITWRVTSRWSQIILASGLWRKVPEGANGKKSERDQDKNLWAQSMKLGVTYGEIMGSKSWLPNNLDPKLDVVVDMGWTGL